MRSCVPCSPPRRFLGALALLASAAAGVRAAQAGDEIPWDERVAEVWAGRDRQVLARLAPYAVGQEIAGGFRLTRTGIGREHFEVLVEGPGGRRGYLLLARLDSAPEGAERLPSFAAWINPGSAEAGAPDPGLALAALLEALRRNDDGRFWEAPPDPPGPEASGARREDGGREDRGGGEGRGDRKGDGSGVVAIVVAALAIGGAALLVRRARARGSTGRQAASRWVLPGAIGASAAGMAVALRGVETDDAYTVLRYARNLVDHGELTYNLGERICALTSPLHALVVAALYRATGALVLPNKILGLACAVAATLALALPLRRRGAALLLALALFPASPFVLFWTFGGLETPLLAALLAGLAACAASDLRAPQLQLQKSAAGRAALPFALGGLAVCTRLDAAVFVGPVLLGLVIRLRGARLALAVAAAAGPPMAWLAFAGRYYGHLLPTSFHVKTPRLDPPWILANAAYMAELVLFSGLGLVAGAAAVLAAARPPARAAARAQVRELAWIYAGLAGVGAYGLVAATTHLFYAFRLFVPVLGPAALLAADLAARLGEEPEATAEPAPGSEARGAAGRVFRGAAAAVLALQLLNFAVLAVPGGNLSGSRAGEFRNDGAGEAAAWIARFAAPAEAIQRDWSRRRAQPGSADRPLRLSTFAVGSLPFALPEARVYEQHTAYRHRCRPSIGELAATADYVCVLSPAPEEAELGLDRMEKIFELEAPLSGIPRRYQVFYNPNVAPPILPPRIDAPCLTSGSP